MLLLPAVATNYSLDAGGALALLSTVYEDCLSLTSTVCGKLAFL